MLSPFMFVYDDVWYYQYLCSRTGLLHVDEYSHAWLYLYMYTLGWCIHSAGYVFIFVYVVYLSACLLIHSFLYFYTFVIPTCVARYVLPVSMIDPKIHNHPFSKQTLCVDTAHHIHKHTSKVYAYTRECCDISEAVIARPTSGRSAQSFVRVQQADVSAPATR